jgi:NAD(P)-dependent dehydrogenase (short-subunit alcohol dehydrogenase family)
MQMTDNNSTALITGGTSGIGLATAKKLAQLGIHVLVVGRNAERGKKAIDEIRTGGGKADFISSELLGADSARQVAEKTIELGSGRVDILINNAGIYPFGPTHEMTEEQFDRVFSTNDIVERFTIAPLPLPAILGKSTHVFEVPSGQSCHFGGVGCQTINDLCARPFCSCCVRISIPMLQ